MLREMRILKKREFIFTDAPQLDSIYPPIKRLIQLSFDLLFGEYLNGLSSQNGF